MIRNLFIDAILFIGLALLSLYGCGTVGRNISEANKCVNNGEECHAKPDPETLKGSPGRDGSSCTVSRVTGGAKILCTDGTSELLPDPSPGPTGATGAQGPQGSPGTKGAAGTSCTVNQKANGAMISCEDGSNVLVLNGEQGPVGPSGAPGSPAPASAYTVTELVDPCGDAPGIQDEILLRLANGTLVASFSDNQNGLNTRFSILGQGTYMTTDGSHCYFSVDHNNNLYNQHN